MKRMLSGIKPTGQLHLGNYIGALKHFVEYQDEYEMFAFIANLHCTAGRRVPVICYETVDDPAFLGLLGMVIVVAGNAVFHCVLPLRLESTESDGHNERTFSKR